MDKKTNLVGRQVYFKLTKKQLVNFTSSYYLTPNKLYTTLDGVRETRGFSILIYIKPDSVSNRIGIILNPNKCAHLDHLTGWILKRESKENQSNG